VIRYNRFIIGLCLTALKDYNIAPCKSGTAPAAMGGPYCNLASGKTPVNNVYEGLSEQEGEVITEFSLLRSGLESERKRLTVVLEQLTASVRPPEERREGSPFGKREEEATEGFELEKRLALEKHTRELLAEVEHALHKFEEGTYGLCDVCGKPIDPARLEALPQASLCLSCKTQMRR